MRIKKIDVIPLDISPSFVRKISRGTVEPGRPGVAVGKPVLVRVYTDDGVRGDGLVRVIQPFHGETTQSVVCAIRDFYAPLMIGGDPFNLEKFWANFDRVLPGNVNARAPIDYALYDLMAKALELPVYKLIGGLFWDKIPLEWSVGLDTQQKMIQEIGRALEKYGVKIFCLKAGPSERWKQDVENVRAVRQAIGDSIELGIDVNEGYSSETAIRAIRQMEDFGLAYVEQPVPGWDIDGMVRVREAVATPIVADEGAFTLHDAQRILKQGGADIVCVKTFKPGGLCNSKKIAALAEAYGARVNVGGTAHGARMEAAVGAHFYASTRNMAPGAEFVMGITEEDPLVNNPFSISEGCVTVPKGSGFGIEIDEQALSKFALSTYTIE
jgi:L-alanine-DL-glutamate epimerase-like enolase superfamily enzyme